MEILFSFLYFSSSTISSRNAIDNNLVRVHILLGLFLVSDAFHLQSKFSIINMEYPYLLTLCRGNITIILFQIGMVEEVAEEEEVGKVNSETET